MTKNGKLLTMTHFDTVCTLLQHTHRNFSDYRIKKLGKLKHHRFQKAKKEFVFPLKKIVAMSKTQPVRLIMDYVLIGRDTRELTFPFNFVFNYTSRRLEPTLFLLFVLAEINGELYPIALDFWGQEEWALDDGIHLTKLDVAYSMAESLIAVGLEIDELLFDAGFCSARFLEMLNELGVSYICRFPRSRKIESYGTACNAKTIFQNNLRFHFDRHKSLYMASRTGVYANHQVKLVGIANSRERLDARQYFCLITNQVQLKHTQILRHYQMRSKIEHFFQNLKTYLGLCAFHRHHPDHNLIPFFQLRCAGFVILQAFAKDVKQTLFQAMETLKLWNPEKVRKKLTKHWDEWGKSLVNTAKERSNHPLILMQTL